MVKLMIVFLILAAGQTVHPHDITTNEIIAEDKTIDKMKLPEVFGDKFYYFGFGSNMLSKRIKIQNPTAVKVGVGKLQDYRIDFNTYTKRWDGSPATIVPSKSAMLFGTVWEIHISNLEDIDNQEGVHEGIYTPISVPITLSNGTAITARAYKLLNQPDTKLSSYTVDRIPLDRQPSKTYLQCMVKGAEETGIENSYVSYLKSIKHNGRIVDDMAQLLELNEVELFT